MLTCVDCKVNFTNAYLLSKHQNRKVPCNVIFECIRCKKLLSTQNSLEKHYNKKNPCIEIQTENQLEKEKRINVMLQLQNERNDMIKKSKEIESFRIKEESKKEIELIKNTCKKQSPKIINNNINIDIDICINYIQKNDMDKPSIDPNKIQQLVIEHIMQNISDFNECKTYKFVIYI
jgi:hypothetical protein